MAIKTQGTTVAVETTLAATKAITAATAASPVVVTATAHGYQNGDIVKIANVVGMVQLNSRSYVAANVAANTFELKGVDGTLYSTYVSGGDSYKATMSPVGYIEGLPQLFAGQAPTIKTTHLLSVREESIQGLAVSGTVSLTMLLVDADVGQLAMQAAYEAQVEKCYTFTRPDSKVATCVAFCDSFSIQAAQNDVFKVTSSLILRAAASRFA